VKIHLAGIIPVANLKTDFNLDIPACMMPVDAGFTAIQKSVFECAIAGCSTIWIVANNDLAPIVRKRVGEWVHDPVYYYRKYVRNYPEARREIPIYYVPVHPKDMDRRDSYGWSALYGMYSAWWIGNSLSAWLTPEKYYVSFPMSAYNIYSLRRVRKMIKDKDKNFFLTHEGKTVKDNIPLGFTMFAEDYLNCRRDVNKKTTKTFINPPPGELPSEKLPLEERWSARHFEFNEVFEKLDVDAGNKVNLDWYYDIGSWDGYRRFLGSDNFVKKPSDSLIKSRIHSKIAYEVEE